MAFRDLFRDDSYQMKEHCDKLIMSPPKQSSMESYSSFVECPSLWPSLSYNQCITDTEKEIWIAMFDEETTMDLFPTSHPLTPHSPLHNNTDIHNTLNFTMLPSFTLSVTPVKRKHSDDCTESPPRKRSAKMSSINNNKSCVQEAIHNFSFKNFSWQATQSDNCQSIQQSVVRRLDV